MKRSKIFTGLFIALFAINTNVYAEEVNDSDKLSNCLKNDTVCTLTEDVTINSGLVLDSNKNVTLDLGGKTLNLEKALTVEADYSLTIKNGTVKTTSNEYQFIVQKGGNLVLESGTYINEANDNGLVKVVGINDKTSTVKTNFKLASDATIKANYGIVIKPEDGATISNGVVVDVFGKIECITGTNGYNEGTIGIYTNGNIKEMTGLVPVINIDGATITTAHGTTGVLKDDDAPAIYAAGYAIWNIKSGTLTGDEALSIKSGVFNITGGTFNATGKYALPAEVNGDGTEATGAAISVTASKNYIKNVEINIKDATVTSKNGHAVYEGISIDNSTSTTTSAIKSLKVEGGSFTGNEDVGAIKVESNDIVGKFITGGEYNTEVDKEYVDSKVETSEQDGIIYVGVSNKVIVKESSNGEVKVSKESAIAGEKVTLTLTAKSGYKLKSVKAVDKDNKEVKIENNQFTMVDSDVTITAEFEQIIYSVIEGANQKIEGEKEVTIKIDANYDLFDKVYVDGKELEATNYTVVSGSTVVTLNKDYVKSLSKEKHELKVTFKDGASVTTEFTLVEEFENPNTLDNVSTSVLLTVVSIIGLTVVSVYISKKKCA